MTSVANLDDAAAVKPYRHPDPVTAEDRGRIKEARAEARACVRGVARDEPKALRDIFRQEIGTDVRSVSPFLISLVASRSESIDRFVEGIEPEPRWPRSPALSADAPVKFRRIGGEDQEFLVGTSSGWEKALRMRGFGQGSFFMRTDDGWMIAEVVDHSIEIEARIGPVRFDTLFGLLRIELHQRIPDTLAAACVSRAVGDVVDHAALRGRDWPITFIEEPPAPSLGQTLVVETGSAPFRMPWAR